MEDSYTVHRRRKAAAKRREKTPEPSSRSQRGETSEDEDETHRAMMERMADDAEQMQEQLHVQLEVQLPTKITQKEEVREVDSARRKEEKRSSTLHAEATPGEGNGKGADEPEAKRDEQGSTGARPKEVEGNASRLPEARKVERRLKKRSKERIERHSRSTDSSDMEERSGKSPRRTKSPESVRIRAKKSTSARARVSSGDSDAAKKDSIEKPVREKRLSKPKQEDADHPTERKPTGRHSQPDVPEEEAKMRKSETFPRRSTEETKEPPMKRSSTDLKKQIIPLNNDSLIQDFEKAQREYLKRERSILEPEPTDFFQDTQEEAAAALRRRKFSINLTQSEQEAIDRSIDQAIVQSKEPETNKSWFSWLSFFRRKKEDKESEPVQEPPPPPPKVTPSTEPEKQLQEANLETSEKVTLMDFFRSLNNIVAEFKAFVEQNPRETRIMRVLRNRCIAELIIMIIYCGLGAFVFRFTEGAFETFYKCGVKRVKRDFLDSLWNFSHNMREEDWKSMARRKLMEFEEQLHTAHEAGVHTYSGQKSWTFLNAVAYCITVITTIGYGHISPSTTTGRAITIVYAIFGIPMFLIILADFGKLFTRGIKFLWAFVRRLYYTGSCRKVRRTGPVQEVMKGVQLVYDLATFRRPSQLNPEDIEEMRRQAEQSQTVLNLDATAPGTPGTPAMSNFAIDDEFNLPISVAIFILLGYIFVGATLYYMWEEWGFFESFYFVFISMSTIGFGDYVPKHPIYMMCSIVYLVFGLALTSMCINVVQVMLSDSFKQASQKIGATIGFEIAEDDGTMQPALPPPVEIAEVHASLKKSESAEKVAPKAKQEDVDL